MWKVEMAQVDAVIEAHPALADFDGQVDEADIARAQDLLQLQFPDAYLHFLRTWGVGAFGSAEFYGVIAGKVPASSVPCAIFSSLEERNVPQFPADFVVIAASGYGPLFCLATSEESGGDCPIREWNYVAVARDQTSLVAPSFTAFIHKAVLAEIG